MGEERQVLAWQDKEGSSEEECLIKDQKDEQKLSKPKGHESTLHLEQIVGLDGRTVWYEKNKAGRCGPSAD